MELVRGSHRPPNMIRWSGIETQEPNIRSADVLSTALWPEQNADRAGYG